MLPSQAITIIQDRLGNRTGLATRIINEMQLVQRTELESGEVLPWFLLRSVALNLAPFGASCAVPDGFIREHDEGGIFGTSTDGQPFRMEKADYATLVQQEWESSGQPKAYALVGETIYVFPSPDLNYSLRLVAYYQDTLPTAVDTTETLWMAHAPDAMIAAAGRRLCRYLRDKEMLMIFDVDLKEALRRIIISNTAREQTAFEQIMGGT
ncbi:MAG TPA: hypothetical protein VLH56_18950 [Dissulfurispiraceae bacterium]|nr:hypothetical protein [Dissulfurispiraceae bacterium]